MARNISKSKQMLYPRYQYEMTPFPFFSILDAVLCLAGISFTQGCATVSQGWLVGWGLTAFSAQIGHIMP